MNICLWCNQPVMYQITLAQLLSFKKIGEKTVCASCYTKFNKIKAATSCPKCSRHQANADLCKDCIYWMTSYPELDWCHHALFSYNTFAREWMEQFKFTGDIRVAKMISEDLHKKIAGTKLVDFVVPIPISKKSFQHRGFNQVEVLLKTAGIPYISVLENNHSDENQAKKNRKERLRSLQPFSLAVEKTAIVGKKVLLVDDVYTTGRTMLYAVACLKEAGAENIQTLSLFR